MVLIILQEMNRNVQKNLKSTNPMKLIKGEESMVTEYERIGIY